MSNDTINWKDIPGYEGIYQVSNTGLVKRIKTSKGARAGRILVPGHDRGYPSVNLLTNGKYKHRKIHQLVMLAFVGDRPAGIEVNHKNGIRHDNRLENLEYLTKQENITHSVQVLHSHRRGVDKPNSKLNDFAVREIRRLYSEGGISHAQLAKRYGVNSVSILHVIHRTTWKHIE